MQCGAEIIKKSKKTKFCSDDCGDAYRKEHGKPPKYPSKSEREIEDINGEVMPPGSKYASYGKRKAAKMAKAMGKIRAPAGFTSHEERQRRK